MNKNDDTKADQGTIKDAMIIIVDLMNSTSFKAMNPYGGAWQVIVDQLSNTYDWFNNEVSSHDYLSFTGDGFLAIFKNYKPLIAEFEDRSSPISIKTYVDKMLSIRKNELTALRCKPFENEDRYSLTAPRVSIHKTESELIRFNSEFIGPDLDFTNRLNKPNIPDKTMTRGLFQSPINKNILIHSPVFISSNISKYFKNLTYLGEMEAQEVHHFERSVYVHNDSGHYEHDNFED